jgi:hypothetical protein
MICHHLTITVDHAMMAIEVDTNCIRLNRWNIPSTFI